MCMKSWRTIIQDFMIKGDGLYSLRIPGIRSDPVETVNILPDSGIFRDTYTIPDIPVHFPPFLLIEYTDKKCLYKKQSL